MTDDVCDKCWRPVGAGHDPRCLETVEDLRVQLDRIDEQLGWRGTGVGRVQSVALRDEKIEQMEGLLRRIIAQYDLQSAVIMSSVEEAVEWLWEDCS